MLCPSFPLELQSLVLKYALETAALSHGLDLRRINHWCNDEVIRLYCTDLFEPVSKHVFSPQCSKVPWTFLWPYFKGWLFSNSAQRLPSIVSIQNAIKTSLLRYRHAQVSSRLHDEDIETLLHAIVNSKDSKEVFQVCYGHKFDQGVLAYKPSYWELLLNCHVGDTENACRALRAVYQAAFDHWSLKGGNESPEYYPGRADSPIEITASCIQVAVKAGHSDVLEMLLEENGSDAWPLTFSFPLSFLYVRALHLALAHAQVEIAQKMLETSVLQRTSLSTRLETVWNKALDLSVRRQMLIFVLRDAPLDSQACTLDELVDDAVQHNNFQVLERIVKPDVDT